MNRWLDETIEGPALESSAPPAAPHQAPTPQPAGGWVPAERPAEEAPQALVVKAASVAVISAKGGAGKTFVATNLAALVTRRVRGLNTCLADADLAYGQLAATIDMAVACSWSSVLAHHGMAPRELVERLPAHPVGFKLLASPGGEGILGAPYEAVEATVRALVAEQGYDAVFFDCSDRLEDAATEAALRVARRVLVVTIPDKAALAATRKFLEIVRNTDLFDPQRWGIVLNQVNRWHNTAALRAAIERPAPEGMGVPVVAEIPFDLAAMEARARGDIFALRYGKSPATAALEKLAEAIVPALARTGGGGGVRRLLGR